VAALSSPGSATKAVTDFLSGPGFQALLALDTSCTEPEDEPAVTLGLVAS